jgi:cytochrome c biogenesis protein CcdA
MLTLTLGALVAGVLTTLAPCVLPLLPVIVGGSLAPSTAAVPPAAAHGTVAVTTKAPTVLGERQRALLIVTSLGSSVFIFTLALRASTALIDIPNAAWAVLSGGLLLTLGLVQILPSLWERIAGRFELGARSSRLIRPDRNSRGRTGAVLTGAALGPVFSSCSPLYAYVVATVLPASVSRGIVLLTAYVLGLAGTLLVIALLGQRAIRRLRWAADPHGWLRRVVGALFILVGLAVLTGADRDLQAWLVQHGPLAEVWTFDQSFIPG